MFLSFCNMYLLFFFFQAEDGIRDSSVTGVQTCALPISIAKWDGSSWTALGSGVNYAVYALAVSGSDLYAGGTFTTAGGKVSAYVARAYLLTFPALSVRRSGIPPGGIMVSWPSADTAGFALEQAATLAAPGTWVSNTAIITAAGTNK